MHMTHTVKLHNTKNTEKIFYDKQAGGELDHL